jgi:hypothetical protein
MPETSSNPSFSLCSLSEPMGMLVACLPSRVLRDDLGLASSGSPASTPFLSVCELLKRTCCPSAEGGSGIQSSSFRAPFSRYLAPGFVVPDEPRDNLLGLEPGCLQAQTAVGHSPLHPRLAIQRGVSVQCLVHLLELPFQVIQEFLPVLM